MDITAALLTVIGEGSSFRRAEIAASLLPRSSGAYLHNPHFMSVGSGATKAEAARTHPPETWTALSIANVRTTRSFSDEDCSVRVPGPFALTHVPESVSLSLASLESAMDDGKQAEPPPDTDASEKPSSITEGVGNLVGSITTLVKDAASVVVDVAKSPPSVSNRVEIAIPPVEENYDAPPMTADELAEHAAADTQPVAKAKRSKRKKAVVAETAAPKKAAKRVKAPKKTAAKKTKKAATKSAKKTTKKMMPKKAAKKSKPPANKKAAKKVAKKTKKSKR